MGSTSFLGFSYPNLLLVFLGKKSTVSVVYKNVYSQNFGALRARSLIWFPLNVLTFPPP